MEDKRTRNFVWNNLGMDTKDQKVRKEKKQPCMSYWGVTSSRDWGRTLEDRFGVRQVEGPFSQQRYVILSSAKDYQASCWYSNHGQYVYWGVVLWDAIVISFLTFSNLGLLLLSCYLPQKMTTLFALAHFLFNKISFTFQNEANRGGGNP